MISRYQSLKMQSIWSLTSRFEAFLKVELASVKALYERNIISLEAYQKLLTSRFNVETILEKERVLKHDVLAFTETVSEGLGEEKKFFHFGLTSTDVVDTAMSLLLKEANDIISQALEILLKTILDLSLAHKETLMMARTHGMYAEATTFGIRLIRFYEDLNRSYTQFKATRKDIEVIKLSGAVGTYTILPRAHELLVMKELDLHDATLSTQVLARDRHARYVTSMALISSVIEDFALDIRLLSRSDVNEVSEGFSQHQKGSSAMPHKRNPIISENLTGLSRMMRGYVTMVFENIALWHERDISHSSVERVVLEDATSLLEHSIRQCHTLISQLDIHHTRMQEHIDESYGTLFTQTYLHIAILSGLDRIKTYEMLQQLSFKAIQEKTPLIVYIEKEPFFQVIFHALKEASTMAFEKNRLTKLYEQLRAQIR